MTTHLAGCLICGAELVYGQEESPKACRLCGREVSSNVACAEAGHFVCDNCHSAPANDVIEKLCLGSESRDPLSLAVMLMKSPAIKMHGPEHHYLVPAVLLTAYDNALGRAELKPKHLAEARRRAERVPGGFCGSHGNCGAGVGAGIFWSVVTSATPLSRESWRESHIFTARSLLRIAENGGPRCCKRDTFLSIQETAQQVARYGPAPWEPKASVRCEFHARNQQCLREECAFYS